MDEKKSLATEAPEPFRTMDELRLAHLKLMESSSSQENFWKEPILSDIKAFVNRAKTTGTVLGESVGRREAQGILDYWSSNLVSIGVVDLRTWSQPRIDAYVQAASADVSATAAEMTKAELSKIENNSRQLVRIGALARQWKTSGMSSGYLLTGDALKEAVALKGQDADVDLFLSASEADAKKSSRNMWLIITALSGFLVVAVVMSALTATKFKQEELNTKIKNVELQNDQIGEVLTEAREQKPLQQRYQRNMVTQFNKKPPPVIAMGTDQSVDLSTANVPTDLNDFTEDALPQPPPLSTTGAPDIKTLDSANEEDRMAAALDFNRLLRSKENSAADRVNLAKLLVGQTGMSQFSSLSLEGRHYLLFVLSLIPTQNWDAAEWSGVREEARKNLAELQAEIAVSRIQLDPKSTKYLDALSAYVGLQK